MNSFTLPAFAKINWFLKILGRRDDDFHEIRTAFQTVSLRDNLHFSENDLITLTCDVSDVPTDEGNLIIKAANILREKFNVKKGARIHLEKKIPSPGGLGGGSSNAAVALIGLARLWQIEISSNELLEIASTLGSDVPFFLCGGTALGTGRGTEITPLEDLEENFLLIVTPDVSVSTARAFAQLNFPRLTKFSSKSILKLCRDKAGKQYLRQFEPENDFEEVVFKIEPEIERVKKSLLKNGAKTALTSGSGASVFAIFENEETRQATIKALANEHRWRMFAVATVSRKKYREKLKLFPISF
ncbi:MAG: 4-(cytidine 5'-diphospho)-2-C-methyl-D-erythritol kinase [Pyrinomonadaceae bacterium]